MTLHYKVGGVWTEVDRPYIKSGGVWIPIKEVWTKESGAWAKSYEYDITPPDSPLVSLEIEETTSWSSQQMGEEQQTYVGRRIKVGVRQPGGAHDDELKMIRVLTTYNDKAPSTQFGGTYTGNPGNEYPDEPWSDFSFNGHNDSKASKDSSQYHYKVWPRNAGNHTVLEPRTYHFTAWAQDVNGNWSTANAATINVPKRADVGTEVKVKEARFQANTAGSVVSGGFSSGILTQRANPISRGIWLYGSQIRNSIGSQGQASIRSAQIYVHRRDDNGRASANVYLHWHEYTTSGSLPTPGNMERKNITKIGEIGKGEAKWFPIPDIMREKMESRELYGFGLSHKDPDKAEAFANDYSVMKPLDQTLRSGEVHVVWTEKL